MPQAWLPPTLTCVHAVCPLTRTGVAEPRGSGVTAPSWPTSFVPQQKATPVSSSMPHEKYWPAESCDQR